MEKDHVPFDHLSIDPNGDDTPISAQGFGLDAQELGPGLSLASASHQAALPPLLSQPMTSRQRAGSTISLEDFDPPSDLRDRLTKLLCKISRLRETVRKATSRPPPLAKNPPRNSLGISNPQEAYTQRYTPDIDDGDFSSFGFDVENSFLKEVPTTPLTGVSHASSSFLCINHRAATGSSPNLHSPFNSGTFMTWNQPFEVDGSLSYGTQSFGNLEDQRSSFCGHLDGDIVADALSTNYMSPLLSSSDIAWPTDQASYPPPGTPGSSTNLTVPPEEKNMDLKPRTAKWDSRHLTPTTRLFSCPIKDCNHTARTKRDIQRHLNTQKHRDDAEMLNSTEYSQSEGLSCPFPRCKYGSGEKKFHRRDNLMRHIAHFHVKKNAARVPASGAKDRTGSASVWEPMK